MARLSTLGHRAMAEDFSASFSKITRSARKRLESYVGSKENREKRRKRELTPEEEAAILKLIQCPQDETYDAVVLAFKAQGTGHETHHAVEEAPVTKDDDHDSGPQSWPGGMYAPEGWPGDRNPFLRNGGHDTDDGGRGDDFYVGGEVYDLD